MRHSYYCLFDNTKPALNQLIDLSTEFAFPEDSLIHRCCFIASSVKKKEKKRKERKEIYFIRYLPSLFVIYGCFSVPFPFLLLLLLRLLFSNLTIITVIILSFLTTSLRLVLLLHLLPFPILLIFHLNRFLGKNSVLHCQSQREQQ